MQQFFMVVGAALASLIAYTVWGMIRLQTATKGSVIDLTARHGEALVIIDVQEDFTTEKTYPKEAVEAALLRINAMISKARGQGMPVINVRSVFKGAYVNFLVRLISGGRGGERSSGLGTDPRLQLEQAVEFVKHSGDAFSNLGFGRWLDEHAIGKLLIVGLDGNACVKSTADGALNRGYQVEIVDPAVLAQSASSWDKQKVRLEARGVEFTR